MAAKPALFISDLHLSAEQPLLTAAYLQLLTQWQPRISALYILGDWFESWIGDDDDDPWLQQIAAPLRQYQQDGIAIYFQPGNRDFLLGQGFLDQFGGVLLPDLAEVHVQQTHILLEHGDALCTDDVAYQQFRQQSRQPDWQAAVLAQPLAARRELARQARQRSRDSQANLPQHIGDVTDAAVTARLTDGFTHLLHGHTHRPARHQVSTRQQRVVLGDWRILSTGQDAADSYQNGVAATIALLHADGDLQLRNWIYHAD